MSKEKVMVSVQWTTWVEVEAETKDNGDIVDIKEVYEDARIKWQDKDFYDDFDLEFDIV